MQSMNYRILLKKIKPAFSQLKFSGWWLDNLKINESGKTDSQHHDLIISSSKALNHLYLLFPYSYSVLPVTPVHNLRRSSNSLAYQPTDYQFFLLMLTHHL